MINILIKVIIPAWFIISIINYTIMLPDETKKNMSFKNFIWFILTSPIVTIIALKKIL